MASVHSAITLYLFYGRTYNYLVYWLYALRQRELIKFEGQNNERC